MVGNGQVYEAVAINSCKIANCNKTKLTAKVVKIDVQRH